MNLSGKLFTSGYIYVSVSKLIVYSVSVSNRFRHVVDGSNDVIVVINVIVVIKSIECR